MRKQKYLTLGLGILLSISLCACQPGVSPTPTPQPTPVPPTSTPIPTPTTEPTPTPEAIVQTVDYGSWKLVIQSKPNGLTYAAGFHDESYGLTIGYAGDVRYTTDGGQNWLKAENTSMCRFGLDIVDEHVAWHCGNGGAVRVSLDGGRTWEAGGQYGPSHPNHCRFLSFLDDKTGWAATPSKLGMTTDGAQTWVDLTLPEGIQRIAAISLRTPNDGYVLDASGSLFATQDGGKTWTAHTIGLKNGGTLATGGTPMAAMRFLDEQQGVIVYQIQLQIWAASTVDGGQTWQHELIPGIQNVYAFYLTHDGELLTLFDASKVVVLRHEG